MQARFTPVLAVIALLVSPALSCSAWGQASLNRSPTMAHETAAHETGAHETGAHETRRHPRQGHPRQGQRVPMSRQVDWNVVKNAWRWWTRKAC